MPYKSIRRLFLKFFRKPKRLSETKLISFMIFLINNSTFDQKFERKIMDAIDSQNYRRLKKLIKLWPDFSPKKSSLVINKCIDSQSYDVLNYLLTENMIDINCCLDPYGWTAFHRAVYNKDIQLLVLLKENEANINVTDINGNTPFHILLQSSTNLITTDNKSVPDLGTDIHYSIVILKLLLDYCKSQLSTNVLNKRNNFGKTVLHYAVINTGADEKTLLSLMSLLLDSGCDPDARDRLQRTPLFCALNEQSFSSELKYKIVDKLIQANCDPLNLYELSQFRSDFTLKQLSRNCLLKSVPIEAKKLSNLLPKPLNSYLNIKLISMRNKS